MKKYIKPQTEIIENLLAEPCLITTSAGGKSVRNGGGTKDLEGTIIYSNTKERGETENCWEDGLW